MSPNLIGDPVLLALDDVLAECSGGTMLAALSRVYCVAKDREILNGMGYFELAVAISETGIYRLSTPHGGPLMISRPREVCQPALRS